MSKKKILLCTRPIIPPWDEASKNLAYDIATNIGNKFQINLMTPKNESFNFEIQQKFPHIKTEEIYSSANLGLKEKTELLKKIFQPKLETNLVHFLFTPRPLTSFLFKTRLKNSKIKTIQTVATISEKSFSNKKKLNKFLFADKIIIQSKRTLEKLEKAGFDKAELIYPGINFEKYKPEKKDAVLLKTFNLSEKDFVILYTGEYTRLKAIDDIVKSIKIVLSKESKNLKLILACRLKSNQDKIKKEEIRKELSDYEIIDKIIFIDTFAEMNKLYNLSDLNIFPVREMAGKFDIPLTVVESMACKKPILVSDLDNLLELADGGKAGLICKAGDPADLAQKINLLIKDKKMYNELAKKALEFAKKNFDIKENVKKYKKIYEELLS